MFSVRTFKKGFTLIELMIVIAVIAILATIALFGLGQAQKSARDTQRQQIMNGVRASLERYNGDKGGYPAPTAVTAWGNGANQLFNATVGFSTYIPGPLTDPGCGGGTTYNVITTNAPCGSVVYAYAATPAGCTTACTGYTLTLTKEGGGTNTFSSPQ